MSKTRVDWIESARSLAMIGVVANHGYGEDVFDLIGKSAVFLFFFLSAYFIPFGGRKIMTRVAVLAIAYLTWNLIYGAVAYVSGSEMSPEIFFVRLFGLGEAPFNAPFWFLRDLILFHVVWYFVRWSGRHAPWLLAACLIACWLEPFRDVDYPRQTCPYWMTPFLLGVLCRTVSVARLERYLHPGVVLPVAVFFAWCAAHYERGLHPAAWMSLAVCGAVTLAAIAFYVARFDGLREALYFVLPPPCVMFVYAMHWMFIYECHTISNRVFGWFAVRFMPEQITILQSGGYVVALLAFVYTLCRIFDLMNRWVPALLKPLNAGRLPIARSATAAGEHEKTVAQNELRADCAAR